MERDLVAVFAFCLRCRAIHRQHIVRHTGERAYIVNDEFEMLSCIEDIFSKARARSCQLLAQRAETLLFLRCEISTAEAKIAQRIGDHLLSHGWPMVKVGALGERAVARMQARVLCEFGIQGSHPR